MRFWIIAVFMTIASQAEARSRDGLPGSATALEYSIRHDVIRPRESVTLLACLTNQNPFSGRDIATGDAFTFTFGGGTLGDCGGITVFDPGGGMTSSDFECSVEGRALTLRYAAGGAPWRPGACACARVEFVAPGESITVMTSQRVNSEGAFSHPTPGAVLLAVAEGLGSIGPTGPQGPVGPQGPAGPAGPSGPSGVGNLVQAESTGVARARQNEPPVPVPGLDVTLEVQAGSRVLVLVEGSFTPVPQPFCQGSDAGDILVEFDGHQFTTFSRQWELTWLSDRLDAGPHRIRVLVEAYRPPPGGNSTTDCVGGTDPETLTRLIAIELRGP